MNQPALLNLFKPDNDEQRQSTIVQFSTMAPLQARVMVWDVVPDGDRERARTYPTPEEAEEHRTWNATVCPRWVDAPSDPPTA